MLCHISGGTMLTASFFDKERPSQEKSQPYVQIFQGKVGAIVL